MKHLLWVGIPHMVLLYLVGRSLPVTEIAVQTLHKAGFLHTLIGLGAAVTAVAQEWGKSGQAGLILAPIGAALVPHILGVWFGHQIEMKNSDFDADALLEELRKQSEKRVKETLELLNQVQTGFKNLATSLDGAFRECANDAEKITAASNTAVVGIKSASNAAVAGIKVTSGATVGEITTVSGDAVGKITAASNTAVVGIKSASNTAKEGIVSALKEISDNAKGTKEVTEEISKVANQLKVVEQQIIELLKTSLIKEAA
jgi:soluble cytochrome b562